MNQYSGEERKTADHTSTSPEVLWIGGVNGMEADLVSQYNIEFEPIPAAGLHGVGLKKIPHNLGQLLQGVAASRKVLNQFKPDTLFFTGGYTAIPVALANRIPGGCSRARSLVFVPDIEPGLAIKMTSRFCDCIAVTNSESRQYFPENARIEVTGYPTRQSLRTWNEENAYQTLNLNPDLPTLLVFGGSRGARSINRAISPILSELLKTQQIIHISGKLDWHEIKEDSIKLKKTFTPKLFNRYHPFPYLHDEMGAALTVSDLVVSRAGASTLGEFPIFGIPAILVPYPHAWKYQYVNAQYLEKQGAALVVRDEDLPTQLLSIIQRTITDNKKLEKMRSSMRKLAQPGAAEAISKLLGSLSNAKQRR